MAESLTKASFSALRWNYAGLLVRSVSTFIIGVVLARLLGPKPFGEVAAVALLFGLANQLTETGFGAALVQAPDLTETDIRFAFTIQMLAAVTMTGLTVVSAGAVSRAFHDPALGPILRVVAPLFILQSFGQTSTGLLRRRLQFKSVQAAQISSYLLGYLVVGVPCAYWGAGVWSLLAAQLVQSFSYSVQVYWRIRHSILFCINARGIRLLRFGTKVVGTNLANWSISNVDNAVVGHSFGSMSLGFYSRAFNLANAPADGIVSACQQVLFSSCSRAANRLDAIRRAYLASIAGIGVVLLPLYWSMAACTQVVILGLYGPRWSAVSPLLRPLALALPLHALMALAGPLLAATDRVKLELRAQLLTLAVAAAVLAVAARHSVTAVAWAVLGIYAFRCYLVTNPALRVLGISWGDLFRVGRGPVFAGAVTAAVVSTVQWTVTNSHVMPSVSLISLVLAGVVSWTLLLALFSDFILAPELVALLSNASTAFPVTSAKLLHFVLGKQRSKRHARERRADVDHGRQYSFSDSPGVPLGLEAGESK